MRHIDYQSANAQKRSVVLFLSRLARGGLGWNPGNPIRMHHALSVSIAKQDFRAHHIRSNPSHIILVLFIPIEFPRLLAKREIIANAKNVCSNVVKARTLSAAKVGISFRTAKHMERKMTPHKKLTHRHRAAINPHGRGSRMVFLSQTSTGQPSLFGDTP